MTPRRTLAPSALLVIATTLGLMVATLLGQAVAS
jgi:hypothetical protein